MHDINKEVFALAEQVASQVDELNSRIKDTFSDKDQFSNLQQIVLTGCGDSYFAGKATQYFFTEVLGIPTFAMHSMEAGRYRMMGLPESLVKSTLQVAVSVSGNPPRTIEANQIAKDRGVRTIAITYNEDSSLANTSDMVLNSKIPPIPEEVTSHLPGIRSYLQSLLAEYLLAIHIGELTGKIDRQDADDWRAELRKTSDACKATAETADPKAEQLAKDLAEYNYFVFVADGPNRATADFSAAKLNEAAGLISFAQDTEEWSHLQYFECAVPKSPTFLVTSGDRGHNRTAELLPYLKHIGRITIAVSPKNDQVVNPEVDYVLPVLGDTPEFFAPIVNHIPATQFSGYIAGELGRPYFRPDRPEYRIESVGPSRAGKALFAKDLRN